MEITAYLVHLLRTVAEMAGREMVQQALLVDQAEVAGTAPDRTIFLLAVREFHRKGFLEVEDFMLGQIMAQAVAEVPVVRAATAELTIAAMAVLDYISLNLPQ